MTDRYTSPLSERYASKEMQYIFHRIRNSVPGEDYGLLLQKLNMNWDWTVFPRNRLMS